MAWQMSAPSPKDDSGNPIRHLGRTGFEVHVLGLGGHFYPVGYGPDCFTTPEVRAQLVGYLVSNGVDYFDTTYIEEVELLADSFERANIKKDVIISLYGGSLVDNQWKRKLRGEIEARLDILGYPNAPLVLISVGNGGATYADVISACEALAGLKREGIARNIGLSCHATESFPLISRAIRETCLIDYIMIRFNWKFQEANQELFPVAEEHDVGIVGMKLFCWDCGPSHWDRRISVFEPVNDEDRGPGGPRLNASQRHLLWTIQNSPCDVVVPSVNSMWEAEQNVGALKQIHGGAGTEGFEGFGRRLWDKKEIRRLALYAESRTVRERAEILLIPAWLNNIVIRTLKAHYNILKREGLRRYFICSYHYSLLYCTS